MTEEQLQSKHCDNSRGTSKGARILRNIGYVARYFPINEPLMCVGCGDGLEVDIWRLLGYTDVIGIDIDKKKASITDNIIPINIYDYEPDKNYNIYCAHTLEHLKDINTILDKFRSWFMSCICIIVPIEPHGTKNPSHHSPIKSLLELQIDDIPIVCCHERWNDEHEGIKIWSLN